VWFLGPQMALRCSIQRGGTHTHTHYTPLAWKEARKRDEESRVWSTRRVINERRIPADKEEPPAPPDLVAAQPAPFQNGASLMVIYPSLLFPPILDGIPNPQTYTLWSYRYIKIVSVFKFYLAEKCYQSIPSYYYFILSSSSPRLSFVRFLKTILKDLYSIPVKFSITFICMWDGVYILREGNLYQATRDVVVCYNC
jgi:hypothetical protein